MRRALFLAGLAFAGTAFALTSEQVRTADPAKRGLSLSQFPRTIKLADDVYGYEEIRQPGFTTVSLFVVGALGRASRDPAVRTCADVEANAVAANARPARRRARLIRTAYSVN